MQIVTLWGLFKFVFFAGIAVTIVTKAILDAADGKSRGFDGSVGGSEADFSGDGGQDGGDAGHGGDGGDGGGH